MGLLSLGATAPLQVFDSVPKDGWVTANLDTGAAATVFPRKRGQGFPHTPAAKQKFRTVSGEIVADEGGRVFTERCAHGNKINIGGRVVDATRMFVSGAQVAQYSDVFFTSLGGYTMPKKHPVAAGLRRELDRLIRVHGDGQLTPLREENGVVVFDYKLDRSGLGAAGLGHESEIPTASATGKRPVSVPRGPVPTSRP